MIRDEAKVFRGAVYWKWPNETAGLLRDGRSGKEARAVGWMAGGGVGWAPGASIVLSALCVVHAAPAPVLASAGLSELQSETQE